MCDISYAFRLAAVLWVVSFAEAQSAPPNGILKSRLDAIAKATQGVLGYSLHHLKTGDRIERFGDELFPTDSTLKVAIMGAAMEQVSSGKIGYASTRQIVSGDGNPGGFFYSSATIRSWNSEK